MHWQPVQVRSDGLGCTCYGFCSLFAVYSVLNIWLVMIPISWVGHFVHWGSGLEFTCKAMVFSLSMSSLV